MRQVSRPRFCRRFPVARSGLAITASLGVASLVALFSGCYAAAPDGEPFEGPAPSASTDPSQQQPGQVPMDGTLPKTPDQLRGDVDVALNTGSAFQADGTWHEYFCVDDEDCQVGDVTGDGRDDIVTFTKKGAVYVAVSGDGYDTSIAAKPFRNSKPWHNYFCVKGERCLLGDVNGDGKKDILALAHNGTIWVSYSTGQGFGKSYARGSWYDVCNSRDRSCEIGDVDNDGRADVVGLDRCFYDVGKARYVVRSSVYDGQKFVPREAGCPASPSGISTAVFTSSPIFSESFDLDVGDVTGDGRADAVVFSRSTSADVYVLPSVDGKFPAAKKWHGYFCLGGEDCALADVTGDKKQDVVAFKRKTGEIWVAPSTGSGFGSSSRFAGTNGSNRFCTDRQICRLGNVDGKGKADAVAFRRGTARPVATRPAPAWQVIQPDIDLSTCRDNGYKIGKTTMRALPPEVQERLLTLFEYDYEGNEMRTAQVYLNDMDTEVLVLVAPRDPSSIDRVADLKKAVELADSVQPYPALPLVVVADEATISGTLDFGSAKTDEVVLVARSVVAKNADIERLLRFSVVAGSIDGSLEAVDVIPILSPGHALVDNVRLFQIASTVADEPAIVDTYVAKADRQYRTGGWGNTYLGYGYPLAKGYIASSDRYLPDTLTDRMAAMESLVDARWSQMTSGLDIAGTSPRAVPATSEQDAKSEADSRIADLEKLNGDFYLTEIHSGVQALKQINLEAALEQSVGTVADLRGVVAAEELAESQSRLDAAKANVDRATSALEAANERHEAAKAALQDKPGLLDAIAAVADTYGPASQFLSYARDAVDAAKGATQSGGGVGEENDSGEKSAKDWVKEGATKAASAGKSINSAVSVLQGFASEPECQDSAECRAFALDVEAAHAAVRAATSELGAAEHALAAAEANVRLQSAIRSMNRAAVDTLASEDERAARAAQVFCTLAQDRLDNAMLAVNNYRRVRALHDAPLDPDNPAYNSMRYDYVKLYEFDEPSMQDSLYTALAETDGQPRPWFVDGEFVVGAYAGEDFADLLKTSKARTRTFGRFGSLAFRTWVELDIRLEEKDNGRVTLQVGPSVRALDDGAPAVWFEAPGNAAGRRAIQAMDFELLLVSDAYGAQYNLPVTLERSTANPLVLQRDPLVMQDMSLKFEPATDTIEDNLVREWPGTYRLSLLLSGQNPTPAPWRYFESLDKTWKLSFEVCSKYSNGPCISQSDLSSIDSAQLTVHYRYKH